MKRILFVDDEPMILDGLRNRLRRQRKKWDMDFVESGAAALEKLASQPVDVIVSDMRMPQMDGATLLKRVQDEFPDTVRIVLSGHAELETALRAVPVAHQFLSKPCDAGLLENVVERACSLQALVNDGVVRSTVGKIENLPSLPKVYNQLLVALEDEDTGVRDVARILEQDMGMCAKLLQIANSAFFRLSRTIGRIEEAVSYLGFTTIKQLALAVEVFGAAGDDAQVAGLSLDALQRHALFVGGLAADMFEDKQGSGDAFVAGLLHDVGKLVLATGLPDHLEAVAARMAERSEPMHRAEEGLAGVSHAEVGAYLLGLWGLPYPIVEAVANHHAPERVDQAEFDLVGAVHVADALANEHLPASLGGPQAPRAEVDQAYLEALGVADRLAGWRQTATDKAGTLAEG